MRQNRDLIAAVDGKIHVAGETDRDPSVTTSDPAWPTVGIVIPTKDHADLLAECIQGLEENTDYPHFEVVVVDNGSTAKDALALLEDLRTRPRYRVLNRPGPFNFSALSNDGASATQASMLVFLNNDIAMLQDDWLKALVRWAIKPDVGVVGAKLLFPDGRIQHAGVVVGFGGIAGHVYRRSPSDHGGYRDRLAVAHEITAVTGACIAVERSKFDSIGGFDAENVAVDLSDIDLCLRIRELGLTNMWTPESVLIHRQSASRGVDADPFVSYRKERTYFAQRWLEAIRDDPFFHPGLSLFDHRVALA
jgi:GT2 family glycosyltransferase